MPNADLCIFPLPNGLGGPTSFASQLRAALQARGLAITLDPTEPGLRAILVMGGSRHLDLLWRARRRGVRIVQRLDGMNWIQRRRNTGPRHFLRAEINNLILAAIRRYLAHRIIYQSEFSQAWWQRVRGATPAAGRVIRNGINLTQFSPDGPGTPPTDVRRILMVEAHLGGGMDTGLENAVNLLAQLNAGSSEPWELLVAGDASAALRAAWSARAGTALRWAGIVPRDQIAQLDRSAHMLFSADINAACPNSVIEALACGLPVLAYATGALPEMVPASAGRVVPYGTDAWRLQPPQVAPLANAAREIVAQQASLRPGARAHAESAFDIQNVLDAYLQVLLA